MTVDGQAVFEGLIGGTTGASSAVGRLVAAGQANARSGAMFDQLPSTGYTGATTLTMTLVVPAIGDVMLIGCEAGTVTVTLPDVTRTRARPEIRPGLSTSPNWHRPG